MESRITAELNGTNIRTICSFLRLQDGDNEIEGLNRVVCALTVEWLFRAHVFLPFRLEAFEQYANPKKVALTCDGQPSQSN